MPRPIAHALVGITFIAGCYDFKRSTRDATTDIALDEPLLVDEVNSVVDAGSDCGCEALTPPRPLSPISVSIQSSRTPTLRWELAEGTDGARVELCRDRACETRVLREDVIGTQFVPPAELPAGNVFWRLASRRGAVLGTLWSPTWQMVVRPRGVARDIASGHVPDFNGDGYGDLLLGMPRSGARAGRALLFYGSPTGLSMTPRYIDPPTAGMIEFGYEPASVGDVDGDGFADAVISAIALMGSAGAAYLYRGGPSGLASTPTTAITAPYGPNAEYGWWISGGDVDLDGYSDAAITAFRFNTFQGRLALHRGSRAGLLARPVTTVGTEGGAFSQFSQSTTIAELTGDRHPDLVASEQGWMSFSGTAKLFNGSSAGFNLEPSWISRGTGAYGSVPSSVGDANGDGFNDLLVGAVEENRTGRVHLFLGSAEGIPPRSTSVIENPIPTSPRLNGNHQCVGDVNADGFDDFVIASADLGSEPTRSQSHLYLGSAGGLPSRPSLSWESPAAPGGRFGEVIASMGDANGDGADDIAIAAYAAQSQLGRVYVYYGAVGALPSATADRVIADPEGGQLGRGGARSR